MLWSFHLICKKTRRTLGNNMAMAQKIAKQYGAENQGNMPENKLTNVGLAAPVRAVRRKMLRQARATSPASGISAGRVELV